MFNKEPVAVINALNTAFQATVPLLVTFGVVALTKEQSGVLISAFAAWTGLIGTLITRQLVTPVANPKNDRGQQLVPQS